uniref:Uncharacterized protein n=1 Tax=Oryza nivara TaxID=4536 RepID=A0A0E0FL14_ORYNI
MEPWELAGAGNQEPSLAGIARWEAGRHTQIVLRTVVGRMADPVGIVGFVLQIITDIVPKIKEEVDRVRQNKKECLRIRSRAERISHTLSPCRSNVELMNHLDVSEPVRALGDILREALKTVATRPAPSPPPPPMQRGSSSQPG